MDPCLQGYDQRVWIKEHAGDSDYPCYGNGNLSFFPIDSTVLDDLIYYNVLNFEVEKHPEKTFRKFYDLL